MIRILGRLLLIALFGLTAVSLYFWITDSLRAPSEKNAEKVAFNPQAYSTQSVPTLDMLLVQLNTETDTKRVMSCGGNGCTPRSVPLSLSGEALFDGESWYHYVEKEEKGVRALQRTWPEEDNRSETIVEETQFVSPRGLLMSSDGKRVAYWLDNVTEDDEELTELWVYDSGEEGTYVVAEKLVATDILTTARWNKGGTAVWFVADSSGKRGEEKQELIVIDVITKKAGAKFSELPISTLRDTIDHGVMDISNDGETVAITRVEERGETKLLIANNGGKSRIETIQGSVPHVQWLEDNRLLYVTQTGQQIGFWVSDGERHTPIARMDGRIRAAYADQTGEFVAFVADTTLGRPRSYVLHVPTGLVKEQGEVTPFGNHVFIVRATKEESSVSPTVAGITTELNDGELIAFVEKHVKEITADPLAQATRVVATDDVNTIYLDYITSNQQTGRVLVTIHDAINPEWTVKARYKPVGAQWFKVQGGSVAEPQSLRVYEWEAEVSQWILKTSIEGL